MVLVTDHNNEDDDLELRIKELKQAGIEVLVVSPHPVPKYVFWNNVPQKFKKRRKRTFKF